METKAKRKTTVSDALGFIFQSGYFGRTEYAIPREMQLSIDEQEAAFGNSDGFANEAYYERLSALPCFDGMEEASVREILSKRRFHLVCGKTDITLAALESVYELRQKYGIRKFLLLTSDAIEREQLSRTISVMQDHFSEKYYGLKLNIMIYDSDNPVALRSFALSDDIQLLVVNKEYFIRSNNRIKRPSPRLDGLNPISMISPARAVAITVSENLKDVRAVLKYASLFDPLCTLSFTKTGDGDENIVTVDGFAAPTHINAKETDDAMAEEDNYTDNFHISI